jgi:MFS family permease
MLSLGFGLVGIDRFLISTLFPVIAADLHLSYSDIGAITGALAVAWGISATSCGCRLPAPSPASCCAWRLKMSSARNLLFKDFST